MATQETAITLSPEESETLRAVLDTLIPPSEDRRFPAAGALGLAATVASQCARVPGLLAMVREGLGELERASVEAHGASFTSLDPEEREQLLAQQAFVFPLVIQAYIAYYQRPEVLAALGLEPRPPHPHGHRLSEE
jgi:hypothetical protein